MLQKITATQLFNGFHFLPNDTVLIIDKLRGVIKDIVPLQDAGDDIIKYCGIVCPGFVNAHCHLELSYLHRKIKQHVGMRSFIQEVIDSKDNVKVDVQQAIYNADNAMYNNGIVAVGDICNTALTIPTKLHSKLQYTNFIELSGFVPSKAQQRYTDGLGILQQFASNNLAATLVPHSPYSVSKELMQLIYNTPVPVTTMHYQESIAEQEFVQHKQGDLLQLYTYLGIDISHYTPPITLQLIHPATGHIMLVHNVTTTAADIAVLNTLYPNRATLCLCPNANLYIGNGLPNIPMLASSGIPICLGTDSLASNNKLSLTNEMYTILKHYPTIPVETVLQWATYNGAKALNIHHTYGSFAVGMSSKYVTFTMQDIISS